MGGKRERFVSTGGEPGWQGRANQEELHCTKKRRRRRNCTPREDALRRRNADRAAAARRAIDCSADSPPAKRAKTATAAELIGGWSQEDLLGASQSWS